jgi:hypothetical protein
LLNWNHDVSDEKIQFEVRSLQRQQEEYNKENLQREQKQETFSLANPAEVWTQPSDKILVVLPPDWTTGPVYQNMEAADIATDILRRTSEQDNLS